MNEFQIICLILLLQAMLDAAGDSFRRNGRQLLHHSFEAVQIVIWLGMLQALSMGWYEWHSVFLAMYLLGRFQVFDYIYNLISKHKWFYVGESSLYGRFITFMSEKVFKVPLVHAVFMPKLMALAWWVAWFFTNGGR